MENKHLFKGVLTRDQKIPILNKGEYVLINLDDINGKGTHWVGLKKSLDNKLLYYDSFNQPPPKNVTDYAKQNKNHLYYNDDNLKYVSFQNIKSTSCGYFTVKWFNQVNTVQDYRDFNKLYGKNSTHVNEQIINKMFNL